MLRVGLSIAVLCLITWIGFDTLTEQRDTARQERDSAQREVRGLQEAARISGEMLAERDAIDQRNTTELTHARTEIERLRRAVDDGSLRLRIRATCSVPGPVPATAGAAGVAAAGGAELAADARPDYFALREELALSRQMILGLQQYALGVCRRTPANPGTTFPNPNERTTP
ncbi:MULTISPECIES: lysis system i-spanin subunit Rz [unclassified Pseudomonas]|uniref:lysis system i-spanin subunit Rz n=1 Tax=unclassified Pseudomonas TaxID=196821 RepID=UPI000A1D8F2A|nr:MULTISPECIES: lysis system i-spanin subunit Rz [unclassified Pseudomonas]